jgi:hypothetical protein
LNLSILYTANIQGDLTLLPRLYTFIKSLQADIRHFEPEDENEVMLCAVQPRPLQTLLLDLGDSCAADVWHCAATGGRSTLIALDAMGYHAANVTGILLPESRNKLAENVMSMGLVDSDHPWQLNNISIIAPSQQETNASSTHSSLITQHLQISLTPVTTTRLALNTLHLSHVEAGQIGTAYIGGIDSEPNLLADAVFDLPADTPPDPTISGTVDFVTNEARFFSRKRLI